MVEEMKKPQIAGALSFALQSAAAIGWVRYWVEGAFAAVEAGLWGWGWLPGPGRVRDWRLQSAQTVDTSTRLRIRGYGP